MGTILDSPEYKNIINSKNTPSLCSIVNVGLSLFKTSNPLENGKESTNSFTRINKESAIILARAFSEVTPEAEKPFVYISAHDWNPLVPSGYIQSKRAAEKELATIPHLRNVFLRPGFMYDSSPSTTTVRDTLSKALRAGEYVSDLTGFSKLGLLPRNPLIPVQVVARAAIEALDDSSVDGVVSLEALQKFATFEAEPKIV